MKDEEIVKKLKEILNDDLYSGSKDWKSSNIVERVMWLISSYESAKEEIEYYLPPL